MSETEPRGYKNLFLQIFQLKNFLQVVGWGMATSVFFYTENSNWSRFQPFFWYWVIFIIIWFLFILFIYKGELENRVVSYVGTILKRIVPILLFLFALYLILLPFELKKSLGTLTLALTAMIFLIKNKGLSKLSNNVTAPRMKNKKEIRLTNWTATETNNRQGADYREVALEGKSLKALEFRLKPSTIYWRAGFKITDPDGSILPLRTTSSFLFHMGSTESKSKFGVTAYINGDWIPYLNKTLDFDSQNIITIKFEVNQKNFIKCFINNKVEFELKDRIDPKILKKVFLAAWGDGNPYRVEFDNIEYLT
ncbi:MAG: hypothetical protein Q8P72_05505 [Candidatus Roizmanbacteria bacterium]|nr:hypothetical protein [Candidatus Roizmanbacteria bacterium]